MIRLIFILLCFLFCHVSFAQDELKRDLENKISQTNKFSEDYFLYTAQLARVIQLSDLDRSLVLINDAIKQEDVVVSSKNRIEILKIAISIYLYSNEFTAMNLAIEELLVAALRSKKPEDLSYANYYKGRGLSALNDTNSLSYFFKALKLAEKTNNDLLKSKLYYRISSYYADNENLVLENKYANYCLAAAIKSKDPEQLTLAWQAKGTYFFEQNKREVSKIDSTLIALKKGISIFNKNKDKIILQNQLGILQLNVAVHFYQFYMPFYKDSVETYANLALKNGLATNDKQVIINCNGLLSELAYKENDLDKVEKLLLKSKLKAESYKVKQPELLSKIYFALAKLYKKKNDPDQVVSFYELYVENYRLFIEKDRQRYSQLLDAKYELNKKRKQIKFLDDKSKAETKQKHLSLGIAVALFISLILIFMTYNYKLKYSIEQQKLLKVKTEEDRLRTQLLEEKAKLKTEEAARLEVEQELILAQKNKLQKELLAESLQVEYKNEILLQMKDKLFVENLNPQTIQNLSRIINNQMRLDKDFKTLKADIKGVNPEFIEALQKTSNHKLTQLDIKYCLYIKLNLSTKQMANLLHVEPSSIRMKKYRLKQKLNLSKDQNLSVFLNSI
ncbi:hypothetical protein Q4588_12990 [Tamlana sp. 1_MG-2023]|nr:hypothetical protein [Tamlana sp. 1_MG-2023]MDO6791821.1 hypothetical protein [Tamlana sp. 1_MG-2023]